jgi:hypothetical protein
MLIRSKHCINNISPTVCAYAFCIPRYYSKRRSIARGQRLHSPAAACYAYTDLLLLLLLLLLPSGRASRRTSWRCCRSEPSGAA